MTATSKIELRGVSKEFKTRERSVLALQETSLSIREGEFVALVGPSGCGKSTVLNMIAGLFSATTGEVYYDGQAVVSLNQRVGYMTQKDTVLPWRTVSQNVGLALELACRAVPMSLRKEKIESVLEAVGLGGFKDAYPGQLSGGMRRRVALARLLIYEPETLLMDEPFGALDAQLKLIMHDELLRLTTARGMTVVFVTHDLSEAIALADRVIVFGGRPGAIKIQKDILIARPRDVYRVRFLPEFAQLHEELWDALKDEISAGTDV